MDLTVLFNLSYGLYVIGAKDGNNAPVGCIVNTVFQITNEPNRVAVSVNHENYTAACIQNLNEFTVSILTEQTDPAVIGTFGFKSSRDINKYESTPYTLIDRDLPVLTENTAGWLRCKVENKVDVGTHMLFIAEVIETGRGSGLPPMTYDYYHKVIKGAAPKSAPTYRAPEAEQTPEAASGEKWICKICGYEFAGDFEALPDDWVCPICKQPKSAFYKA